MHWKAPLKGFRSGRGARGHGRCLQFCVPHAMAAEERPQPDSAGEGYQHLGRFAKAEIAASASHIRGQLSSIVVLMLTPLALRVVSRIRRLNRSRDLGAMMRLTSGPAVKLNPRNLRSCGRATALLASFTLSLSFCVMNRVILAITR